MQLLLAFQQVFPGHTPDWLIKAPGRELWAAAIPAGDATYTFIAPDMDARTTFSLRGAKTRSTVTNRPLPRWARYAAGVLLALDDLCGVAGGLQVVIVGLEPPGPRYDYAIGMLVAALLYDICGCDYTGSGIQELVERIHRDYAER